MSCFRVVRCRAFIAFTIDVFINFFMSRFLSNCFELFLATCTKIRVLVTMLQIPSYNIIFYLEDRHLICFNEQQLVTLGLQTNLTRCFKLGVVHNTAYNAVSRGSRTACKPKHILKNMMGKAYQCAGFWEIHPSIWSILEWPLVL